MRNAGQHIYAALTKPHKLCKTSSQDSQDLARSSQDLAKHGFALSAYSRDTSRDLRDTSRNIVLHCQHILANPREISGYLAKHSFALSAYSRESSRILGIPRETLFCICQHILPLREILAQPLLTSRNRSRDNRTVASFLYMVGSFSFHSE